MSWERAARAGGGLPPVRQWRVHVGAHKTATTHLQETLAALRGDLVRRGVDFIPTAAVRRADLAVAIGQRRPSARLPLVGPARMRGAIEAVVTPLRAGPDVVVLSEENILGMPHHMLMPTCYPQATVNLGRIASLARRAEVVLFLSIRGYETLVPSAYVETLKHGLPPAGGFAGMWARLSDRPPSWFDLVARIRAAAPGVSLRIWRHEDYRPNAGAIMAAMVGPDSEGEPGASGSALGPLPALADPAWTRSPSAAAIAAVEALPADMPMAERRVRVRALFAAGEPGADRFRPFDEAERKRLRARYEDDLARIARALPGALMTFSDPAAPRVRGAA